MLFYYLIPFQVFSSVAYTIHFCIFHLLILVTFLKLAVLDQSTCCSHDSLLLCFAYASSVDF